MYFVGSMSATQSTGLLSFCDRLPGVKPIGEQGRAVERERGEPLMDTAPCAALNLNLPGPKGPSGLEPNGKPNSFSAD